MDKLILNKNYILYTDSDDDKKKTRILCNLLRKTDDQGFCNFP